MSPTIVDSLHTEFAAILAFLEKEDEVSWRSTVDDSFKKVLLIATASHFERSIQETILDFVQQIAGKDHPLTSLVQNKVIGRQYHTWFDWKTNNANQFFGLFGDAFKNNMKEKIGNDDNLDSSIKAFMEIGRERNRLLHEDFGNFTLEKTSEEIYKLYSSANGFVEWFPSALKTFTEEKDAD